MAFTLSSLDVWYMVRELKPLVQDAYVDKIYQGDEDRGDFLFKMRSPSSGKQQLYVRVPEALFLTDHRFSWPQHPKGFCMQLRKHLTNAQLKGIEQHGFDRIVEIVFVKGDCSWKIVIELFSKGNVVLVDSEGLIRGVMDLQRWKDRTLRVNEPYSYPPGKHDVLELSSEDFCSLFRDEGKDAVRFCATVLGLGGKYAEELVARTGLDKARKDLSLPEMSLLHEGFKRLLELDSSPVIREKDAAPFPLIGWEGEPQPSFSAAVERLVVEEKTKVIDAAAGVVVSSKQDKLQRIIDEQTAKIEGYHLSAAENQRKGEMIYERYQELSSLFRTLQDIRGKGGWDAVRSYLKERGLPVAVDEQRGLLVLTIND